MRDGTGLVFRSAPDVVWVKDSELTLIVDAGRGTSWSLSGTDQAIWDLLTLGYAMEALIEFASQFLGQPPAEASATILAKCQEWAVAGLLCVERACRDERSQAHCACPQQSVPETRTKHQRQHG